MKGRRLSIGEISKILDIPTSKLRFWENQGLFSISKRANKYRSYTTTDLIQIADILFYRNLGIPIREINNFSSMTLREYGSFLQDTQQQLEDKIRENIRMYQRICRQQQCYSKLLQLLIQPRAFEQPPFSCVVSWDFCEKDRIASYAEDPSRYVWFRDTGSGSAGQKGIIVSAPPAPDEPPPLWKRTEHAKFLTFPVRAYVEDDYRGLESESIVSEIRQHHRTGTYIARHLLTCAEGGGHIEYLQGYLEILD